MHELHYKLDESKQIISANNKSYPLSPPKNNQRPSPILIPSIGASQIDKEAVADEGKDGSYMGSKLDSLLLSDKKDDENPPSGNVSNIQSPPPLSQLQHHAPKPNSKDCKKNWIIDFFIDGSVFNRSISDRAMPFN